MDVKMEFKFHFENSESDDQWWSRWQLNKSRREA